MTRKSWKLKIVWNRLWCLDLDETLMSKLLRRCIYLLIVDILIYQVLLLNLPMSLTRYSLASSHGTFSLKCQSHSLLPRNSNVKSTTQGAQLIAKPHYCLSQGETLMELMANPFLLNFHPHPPTIVALLNSP